MGVFSRSVRSHIAATALVAVVIEATASTAGALPTGGSAVEFGALVADAGPVEVVGGIARALEERALSLGRTREVDASVSAGGVVVLGPRELILGRGLPGLMAEGQCLRWVVFGPLDERGGVFWAALALEEGHVAVRYGVWYPTRYERIAARAHMLVDGLLPARWRSPEYAVLRQLGAWGGAGHGEVSGVPVGAESR